MDDRGDCGTASCRPGLWLDLDVPAQRVSPDASGSPDPGPPHRAGASYLSLAMSPSECRQGIFAQRLPELAATYARRSNDLSLLVRLFGHHVGGRPSVRLLQTLAISLSGTSVLRQVMRDAPAASSGNAPRVPGLDDWARS